MKPTLLDLAPNKTIGRVDLTWLHAEQVGWGGDSREPAHHSGSMSPGLLHPLKRKHFFHSAKRKSRILFPIHSNATMRGASSSHSQARPGASGSAIVPTQRCRREDAHEMEQFHSTESSCFSSGSRPLCCLPSTQNWKHGTNNTMCYSNFALGLVIRPSAITSVADRTDVHVFPACVPSPPLFCSSLQDPSVKLRLL